MSRERPTAAPPVLPDAERGLKITTRQERQKTELERMKSFQGPAFLAGFFNPRGRAGMPGPQFIRRGYLANILDDLNDFFTFKSWRPKNCRPATRTHKEQLNLRRRMLHAGLIRRLGRGRYGFTKVAPHA